MTRTDATDVEAEILSGGNLLPENSGFSATFRDLRVVEL